MEKNLIYNFCENFIFRSPLVSFEEHLTDYENLFKYSRQAFFKEAIYLASPVLFDELVKWHKGELKEKKEIDKLTVSLYKYYTRMKSRCTPYGLFAGCGIGKWDSRSELIVNTLKRHTRLDMNYLCALTHYFESLSSIQKLLKFYPNNSIYIIGERLRYVEYRYVNKSRRHQISEVDHSPYLDCVLNKAKPGELIDDLAKMLVSDEISFEEAKGFVIELIDNQILVSELEPAITGKEFTHQMIKTLREKGESENGELNSILHQLESIQMRFAAIDRNENNYAEVYREIYESLRTLGVPIEENNLFQADLYKICTTATLEVEIQKQLLDTITFLSKFSNKEENSNLVKFKEQFYNTYEGAEHPLLEVLDTETGIGYKAKDITGVNTFLDDIYIQRNLQDSLTLKWTKQQEAIHKRLSVAIKENAYSVNFTDSDTKTFDTVIDSLPDTMAIMFRVIGSKKLFFQNCGGSSAANLLGRFAHGSDEIFEIIKDITSHEQKLNSDKILAEIAHLPESRTGNILLRPVLRDYEIPYLAKSALDSEKQIQLNDLMISVRENKIILRSKRLNKEIIPRLSTAHNYSYNALPVYQFLCDIQTQYFDKPTLGFSWGVLSGSYKFLPRAEYKNVVLHPARWQLSKSDFQALLDCKEADCHSEIVKWCKFWNIPSRIVLADGDNELYINFEDELSVKMFISIIKKRDNIVLEEFLFDLNDLLVRDSKGNGYTNECIAILLKNADRKTASGSARDLKFEEQKYPGIQRNFSTGSEWLYYKFYCGVKTADKVLLDVIKPFAEEVISKKWTDKFFFIRYSDPDLHIRLRFHLNDVNNIGQIIAALYQYIEPYLKHGLINKVQTDTYKRELERYGKNSIELIETLFYIDSTVTLNLLDLAINANDEHIRWQIALHSVDELLTIFHYSANEKLALLKHLKESFINEHGSDKALRLQLSAKYRRLRNDVESGMKNKVDSTNEIFLLLKKKSSLLQPVINQIIELKNNGQLEVPLAEIVSSCSHMMLNRIFSARQRTCEMIIYDLLYRYYEH